MIEKKRWLLITFHTTSEAMAMEQRCQEAGLAGRLIPVPRTITADCGLAWRAELTTKVRQADRDAFVDACYKTGKSPYATLRQFVLDYAYDGKAKTTTPTPEPVEVFWGM